MRVLKRLNEAWQTLLKGQHPADVQSQETRFGGYMYAPTSSQPDAGPLRETEEVSAIVSRCVNVVSRDAARGVLEAQDTSGDEPTPLPDDNKYIKPFLRPNPTMTIELMIECWVSDLMIEGNSFWWQELSPSGEVLSMWRIPPEQVEVMPGTEPGELISAYRWHKLSGTHTDYDPAEIMHFKTRHPTSPFRGLGHVARLRDSLLLEKEVRNWRYWFFKNGVPATLLLQNAQMGDPSEAEIRRLRAKIHDQILGDGNGGKPLLLSEAWTITHIPRPSEADVAFIATMNFTRAEIAMMFGVVPTKLSDYSQAFRSNAEEQVRDYWFDTVMGWNRIILGFLNTIWLPMHFGDVKVRFVFNYDNVDAIQANKREIAESSAIVLQNAGITPAEFRELNGFPAPDLANIENAAAMYQVYMNGRPLGEDPFKGLGGMFDPKTDDSEEDQNKPVEGEGDENDDPNEEEVVPTDEENDKLASRGSLCSPSVAGSSRRHLKIADDIVAQEVRRMATEVSALIAEMVKISGENQLKLEGIAGAFNVTHPEVLLRIAEQSILVSQAVVPRTIEGVRRAIAVGHAEGLPIQSRRMRQLVQEAFAEPRQKWQLDRISRTEVHQAQESGAYESAKQNGIEAKMWVASLDRRVRETHADLNGEITPMSVPFLMEGSRALMFPGDVSGDAIPEDVINCRCTWVSVRPEDEKSIGVRAQDVWIAKATQAERFEAIFARFMRNYLVEMEKRWIDDLIELRAA